MKARSFGLYTLVPWELSAEAIERQFVTGLQFQRIRNFDHAELTCRVQYAGLTEATLRDLLRRIALAGSTEQV